MFFSFVYSVLTLEQLFLAFAVFMMALCLPIILSAIANLSKDQYTRLDARLCSTDCKCKASSIESIINISKTNDNNKMSDKFNSFFFILKTEYMNLVMAY